MTWRKARESDLPALDAFLSARAQTSMFPLLNLRDHGLDGAAPRGMRIWVDDAPTGLRNMLAITNEGMLMAQAPDLTADLLSAARRVLAGRRAIGALGATDQIRALLPALGLADAPKNHNADEPGFSLDLNRLALPDMDGFALTPLRPPWMDMAVDWRRSYHVEVLGTPQADAAAAAARDIAGYVERDSHRFLLKDGAPVAMTGFNAPLPECVQIGGVYTPPELRGRGYARRAVGLHLCEAREGGVPRAVLFAASDAAAAAYQAIGFQPAAPYSMVLFSQPTEILA